MLFYVCVIKGVTHAYLLSFVDIVTVILQLFLENIRDVNVYSHALIFTLPFGLRLLFFPLCKRIFLSLEEHMCNSMFQVMQIININVLASGPIKRTIIHYI